MQTAFSAWTYIEVLLFQHEFIAETCWQWCQQARQRSRRRFQMCHVSRGTLGNSARGIHSNTQIKKRGGHGGMQIYVTYVLLLTLNKLLNIVWKTGAIGCKLQLLPDFLTHPTSTVTCTARLFTLLASPISRTTTKGARLPARIIHKKESNASHCQRAITASVSRGFVGAERILAIAGIFAFPCHPPSADDHGRADASHAEGGRKVGGWVTRVGVPTGRGVWGSMPPTEGDEGVFQIRANTHLDPYVSL